MDSLKDLKQKALRSLFFRLESLSISRAERRSVSILMVLLLALILTNAIIAPPSPFDDNYYSDIEKAFKKRTALLKQKQKKIMARYKGIPAPAVKLDSIPNRFSSSSPININTANINALDNLPGIGPAYAQNIIDYRNKNGPFTAKEELLKVTGIGDARFAKIKSFIVLGDIGQITASQNAAADTTQKLSASSVKKVKEPAAVPVINVNTADAKTLATLPGIGSAYAQNIVDYRNRNGKFTSYREFLKVKGIGQATLEKLKPLITFTSDESK